MKTAIETAIEAVAAVNGRTAVSHQQAGQVDKFAVVLVEHPDAKLVMCADENTGRRFGRAKCRMGRCQKIGSVTYSHQIWAVW